jgi:hypothetical protein
VVVVVPVDQGQLRLGVVAQPGRQAQGDVQELVLECGSKAVPGAQLGRRNTPSARRASCAARNAWRPAGVPQYTVA